MIVSETILHALLAFFVFAFGACVGSFLNVVAYRLPLGLSVVKPSSHCPNCKTRIPAYALIPVLGYFLVRGRCQKCRVSISPVYPITEFVTGILTTVVVFHHLPPARLAALLVPELGGDAGTLVLAGALRYETLVPLFSSLWLLYTAVPLTIIDLRFRILPDLITLPGTLVGFALSAFNPEMGWSASLIGILTGAGTLYIVARSYEILRKREGLGYGDVKYLGLIGSIVGWQGVTWTIALASLSGALVGIGVGVATKKGLSASIPFGPFLAAGALIVNLYGRELQIFLYGSG